MRSIRGLALGTYYAVRAAGGESTRNTASMRGLLYAVKDNRNPPNPPQLIADPRHPATPPGVPVDRNNAVTYVSQIVVRYLRAVRARLGLEGNAVLVPIPSSAVARTTIEIARWPAYRLALALENVGLGECRTIAVNKAPVWGKTEGGALRSVEEILANLEEVLPVPDGPIVLVDDTVTTGASVVAMDTLLGRPDDIRVFAVGLTDSTAVEDAFRSRRFTVDYDEDRDPLVPTVSR